jgi:hypothetical protein
MDRDESLCGKRDQFKKWQKAAVGTLFAPGGRGRTARKRPSIADWPGKALKTRHFNMALYRRDSRIQVAITCRRFIATAKNGVL